MKKILVLLLAIPFLPSFCAASLLTRGPYLENPTPTSIIIKWRTKKPVPCWLKYGPKSEGAYINTVSPEGTRHIAVIHDLAPNKQYVYKLYVSVNDGKNTRLAASGDFYTLKTKQDAEFSFLAFGESGAGSNEQYQLAREMERVKYDFIVHTGGMISSGKDEDANNEFFTPYKNILSRAPFFAALSPDEYGQTQEFSGSKDFLNKNFKARHTMPWSPGTPSYYFFDYGNARFIFLDANSLLGVRGAPILTPGSYQLRWLEATLAKTRVSWKIVVINSPVYSSGGFGSTETLAQLLSPIFESYGVDLVLQGRDRNYERTFPLISSEKTRKKGVVYVTLGGGGKQLYSRGSREDWSDMFTSEHHFALIAVNGRTIKGEVFGKYGETIDNFELFR